MVSSLPLPSPPSQKLKEAGPYQQNKNKGEATHGAWQEPGTISMLVASAATAGFKYYATRKPELV
jgi:hypothetical protein